MKAIGLEARLEGKLSDYLDEFMQRERYGNTDEDAFKYLDKFIQRERYGNTDEDASKYLDEFMRRERYGNTDEDAFNNLVANIAAAYPHTFHQRTNDIYKRKDPCMSVALCQRKKQSKSMNA